MPQPGPGRPSPRTPSITRPTLTGPVACDLAVVGAGLSGLWAAILAKERDTAADVVVLEGDRIANAASGRNGGFFLSSLTHGIGNGRDRFPD